VRIKAISQHDVLFHGSFVSNSFKEVESHQKPHFQRKVPIVFRIEYENALIAEASRKSNMGKADYLNIVSFSKASPIKSSSLKNWPYS
jgi:hypothetical protein